MAEADQRFTIYLNRVIPLLLKTFPQLKPATFLELYQTPVGQSHNLGDMLLEHYGNKLSPDVWYRPPKKI